ncbi:MAG: hypothetical protein ACM3ZA_12970 [Bacillota bacterium]
MEQVGAAHAAVQARWGKDMGTEEQDRIIVQSGSYTLEKRVRIRAAD